MRRYPHKAELVRAIRDRDDNGDLVEGLETLQTLKGRFQIASGGGNIVDYSAKFFTPKMNIEAFSLNEVELKFEGKQFKIMQHFDFQTHSVLWLE